MQHDNEWISIGDLMGGLVAVLMLLFVAAVMQSLAAKQQVSGWDAQQWADLRGILSQIDDEVKANTGLGKFVEVDIRAGKITLKDDSFERSSGCLPRNTRVLINNWELRIRGFLLSDGRRRVFIEGHTDSAPVQRAVTDCEKHCGCYDDNYTLSTVRAREARRELIKTWPLEVAKRVAVSGYGADRPLPQTAEMDGKNRRVELRFIWESTVHRTAGR